MRRTRPPRDRPLREILCARMLVSEFANKQGSDLIIITKSSKLDIAIKAYLDEREIQILPGLSVRAMQSNGSLGLVRSSLNRLDDVSQEGQKTCQWAPVVQRCHKSESGGESFPAGFFASFRLITAERTQRGRKEPSETSLISNHRCHSVVNVRRHNNDQCSGQARSPGLQDARQRQACSPGLQDARQRQARSSRLQDARLAWSQKGGNLSHSRLHLGA